MANYFKKRKDSKKRETMIVFVYDTEYCQEESDDPVQAVLYFHPSWVSDTQKLSLCGQLMGTTYFLKNCFFKPKIIALQNGKFVLKEFGRFILAIGTDRNLSDSLLEHRAELLTSLLKFFHHDIQTIYDQFLSSSSSASTTKTSANFCSQYKNLSDKLYHIFETYLPILQYNGNIFQNISKLRLPKSASNIFLDAMQTLQSCQQMKGVLGGTILYHNKVVATQLSPEITKNLVLTDPFHIKSSAEPVYVDFYVPIGVQMLIVYISHNDYHKLQYDSHKAQNIVTQNFSNIFNGGTTASSSTTTTSTTTLPSFQFQIKRKIKRDKSLIFTNIPEESHNETNIPTTTNSINSIDNNSKEISTNLTTDNKPITKKSTRPNHLPLKFKNVTSKEIPESGFVSINFDESDSYSEFIGRTSVCSTPMTENKILQYDNILSICSNPTEQNLLLQNDKTIKSKNFFRKQSIEENDEENNENDNENDNDNDKTSKSIKKFNNLLSKIDFDKFFTNFFISNPYKKYERRNSLTDLHDSIKKFSKRLTTTKSTTSLTSPTSPTLLSEHFKNNNNINKECITTNIEDNFSNSDLIDDVIDDSITKKTTVSMDIDGKKKKKRKFFGTITDPMYPIFNSDGEPISKSLFQEFLHKYYNKTNSNSETEINSKNGDNDNGNAKNIVEDDQNTTKMVDEYKEFDGELNKLNENKEDNPTNENKNEEKDKENFTKTVKQIPNRKSLSLPLKPLNDPSSSAIIEKDNQIQCIGNGIFERKKHSGIQLTPLMAKLSILALNNDERSSGFCSWDTTPGLELSTPIDITNKNLRRRSSIRNDDLLDNPTTTTTKEFKKVELYICGQQNMTLLLLMEEGAAQKQNLVQSLFDTCVSKLTRIESQLNQTLNVNVDGDKSEGGYSYICIDPKWDTLQRGGPWSITDMDSLEHMHKDLNLQHSITDLILRTDDSVLYGYKCGSSEFFYKQSAQGHNNGGIPPPADIMGTISMRAKRRLERDHSLILF